MTIPVHLYLKPEDADDLSTTGAFKLLDLRAARLKPFIQK